MHRIVATLTLMPVSLALVTLDVPGQRHTAAPAILSPFPCNELKVRLHHKFCLSYWAPKAPVTR